MEDFHNAVPPFNRSRFSLGDGSGAGETPESGSIGSEYR
jgi:hypothetical protein